MSNKSKIEICANSVESAVKAQQAGAYRVELCAGIPEGGTTPSFGEIRMARQLLNQTKLHVIIRPRGGDFLYSPIEQEIMLHDIKVARQLGADGVVFGCLTAEGYVDVPLMQKLMNAVGEMSVTFHRAFDMCSNPKEALEQIIGLGIDRVLTSGQEATAEKGIPLLKELVEQADGRIIIMPGCGVNAGNIRKIAEETGTSEFHFSGRSSVDSGMIYRNSKVSMGGTVKIEEYLKDVTDPDKVKAALSELAMKDENDKALEKKTKASTPRNQRKRMTGTMRTMTWMMTSKQQVSINAINIFNADIQFANLNIRVTFVYTESYSLCITFISCSPSPMVYPCDTNTTRLKVSPMINIGRIVLLDNFIPSAICFWMEPSTSIP